MPCNPLFSTGFPFIVAQSDAVADTGYVSHHVEGAVGTTGVSRSGHQDRPSRLRFDFPPAVSVPSRTHEVAAPPRQYDKDDETRVGRVVPVRRDAQVTGTVALAHDIIDRESGFDGRHPHQRQRALQAGFEPPAKMPDRMAVGHRPAVIELLIHSRFRFTRFVNGGPV